MQQQKSTQKLKYINMNKRANNDEYWLIEYRMRNYADYYGGMYVNGIYRSDYTYRGERTNGGSDLEAYVTYKNNSKKLIYRCVRTNNRSSRLL